MSGTRFGRRIGSALGGVVLLLVRAVARVLAGLGRGRLVDSVSVPRLCEHPLRTSLTVLGVALGVALLVAVVTVNRSVLRGVMATFDDISGKADLEIAAGSSGFGDELTDTVRGVAGVGKVGLVLQQVASILHPRAQGERVLVVGTDLLSADDAYFRAYASADLDEIKRDPLPFLNSTQNILLGRKLAERLGCRLHDKLALATGTGIQQFEVRGLLELGGIGSAFDGAIAVMDFQAMQLAFSRGRNVDRIEVALAPGAELAVVTQRLRAALGAGFTIEPPARKGERVARMLGGVRTALSMASVIALLVGAFLIHNTMAISVVQRKREIGTLRALGARARDVRALLTLEGVLLGLVGSLLGVALGVAISRALLRSTSQVLNQTYMQIAASELALDPWVLAGGALLGVGGATAAAALAARKATALGPLQALATSGVVTAARPRAIPNARDAAALALALAAWGLLRLPPRNGVPLAAFAASGLVLLAGVLLLPRLVQLQQAIVARAGRLLLLEGRLANANLSRDLGRTSSTAAALMVGVAMVTAFSTFTRSFSSAIEAWVEQTIPGDLFITNASSVPGASSRNVPMADVLREQLLALPEVEDVRRVQVTEIVYGGLPVKLVSTDLDAFARHARLSTLEGSPEQALRGLARGGVAVSENFARRFGVHRGELVPLGAARGARKFEVAAVVVDYTSDMGTVLMGRETFAASYGDERVGTYELYLRAGAEREAVRKAIDRRFGAQHNLFVLTNQEVRADIRGRTTQVFALLRALEVVALLVAVLGLANALFANIVDRVREIGVLRALGMTRRAVSTMVMSEGALIAALGLISGVIVGCALGHIMIRHINLASTGWHFPFELAGTSLLELALFTMTASCIAGFFPARETAGLVIAEALGYE
jgi:putative ABC transport system permease protein